MFQQSGEREVIPTVYRLENSERLGFGGRVILDCEGGNLHHGEEIGRKMDRSREGYEGNRADGFSSGKTGVLSLTRVERDSVCVEHSS